jgi:hypothetical protein
VVLALCHAVISTHDVEDVGAAAGSLQQRRSVIADAHA